MAILSMNDNLPLGKCKGLELWEVMHEDPSYVLWLVEECIIELDQEATEELEKLV